MSWNLRRNDCFARFLFLGSIAAFGSFEAGRRNIAALVVYGHDAQHVTVLHVEQAKRKSMQRPGSDFGIWKQVGKA
jgi:hypothetical protein